jgi:CHAT domain-containing protein
MFPVFEATNRSLLYSLEEANFVEESLPTTLFKNKEATEANFLANANKHNILHISTHASGGDFIVPAHIEFIDQTLELPELYALSMSPQLVVLSACETGVGKVQKGEGAMSLARGFQYAGSKNILFTLWQVNDQTTARWMQLFYQGLATNGSAYKSQYDAKLSYLADSNISNAKKSPYYWSAFTYYGATEPLFTSSTSHWVWITFSSIFLLLLIFVIFKLRKTKQPSS